MAYDYSAIANGYSLGEIKGWVPPDDDTKIACSAFRADFSDISNLPDVKGDEPVLLHNAVTKILGKFPIHKQTIGDCVSHGWSLGIDILKCVEILIKGEREKFVAETATEFTYGISREIVNQLGRWDGSNGSWAAKGVMEVGTILRQKYSVDGKEEDLSVYSGQKAGQWAAKGTPDWLDTIAREHPVKTTALVTNFSDACKAIKNGYPIPVCSGYGFSSSRDSDGFARKSGSWAHCMLLMACRFDRPGALCMNSWGPDWISGPKWGDQPEGSFWIDEKVCDGMLREQDSFAISNFVGYPEQDVNYFLI